MTLKRRVDECVCDMTANALQQQQQQQQTVGCAAARQQQNPLYIWLRTDNNIDQQSKSYLTDCQSVCVQQMVASKVQLGG